PRRLQRCLDDRRLVQGLLAHEARLAQRVVHLVEGVVAVLAPHEREHAQDRGAAALLPVDLGAFLLVDLFQTEQLPVHLNGAHPAYLPNPVGGTPGPRSSRVRVEDDGLLVLAHGVLSSQRMAGWIRARASGALPAATAPLV